VRRSIGTHASGVLLERNGTPEACVPLNYSLMLSRKISFQLLRVRKKP
jgi:hypothetical protein